MVTGPRSLRVPLEAAGLVAALEARKHGDEAPFKTWMKAGFPALLAALCEWLPDATAAKGVAREVLAKAFLAVSAGTVVHDELPWLATLARHVRADARRERRGSSRRVPLPPSLPWGDRHDARGAVAGPEAADRGVRRTPAEAALLLPPPYREAMCALIIDEWPLEEVRRFLELWRHVGSERAVKILLVGGRMLAETMAGADPRKRWRRRLLARNVDNSIFPYPSRGVLRH